MSGDILITGHRGYLAGALVEDLDHSVIKFPGDVREYKHYNNISCVIHFASPSDRYEFVDEYRTATTIINGTMNMLQVAKDNNCKFIYASTLGVKHIESHDDIYAISKLAMENYIKSTYNNYIILRIPRVYSKCRKKGLMRQIRDDIIQEGDMNNIIEYITLQDFIEQTKPVLSETNTTYEYTITNRNTIREIKQWVEK